MKDQLIENVNTGKLNNNEAIVTNSRHYSALQNALEEINKVQEGLNAGISGDLLALDIREALYHFGLITGQVTNDELLGNIFLISVLGSEQNSKSLICVNFAHPRDYKYQERARIFLLDLSQSKIFNFFI